MRVLQIVHQFFPDCHSGTEQYCLAVARASRRAGHEVRILSLEPIDDRRDEPFAWFDKPYDGFDAPRIRPWRELMPSEELRDHHNPLVAARIAQELDHYRPDVVHVFHLRRLGVDVLRVAADRRRRGVVRRIVVHLMDFWYLCPRFTLLKSDGSLCHGPPDDGLGCIPCHAPELAGTFTADDQVRDAAADFARGLHAPGIAEGPANRYAAIVRRKDELLGELEQTADGVIAPSRFLRDVFIANGLPKDRIRVVPYGLEPGRVERVDVQRPRTPLRLGFAGVFSPWKAPHVAIDAVRSRPDLPVSLTLHGRLEEGMFADYIANLQQQAAGDDRIHFPGAFGRDQLGRVLADLDFLIVPSTWHENTPFVILEAFAAGLPVIASRLGGMAEIVRDGENGFLFDAGDHDGLARLLERLVAEPETVAGLRPVPPGPVDDDIRAFGDLYGET